MKEKIKKITNHKAFDYICILLASFVICIPLLNENLNIFRDDGIQHIARLIGTESSLHEGNFFPMIMSDFCNGFGYSWNIFYSILTSYMPLIFRLFGFSYIGCLKLFLYGITVLSGISMYAFTKRITKRREVALLASFIYILLPYRMTDLYLRVALAELASFIFIPMVFHGIYNIIQDGVEGKKHFSLVLLVGTIGLFLSHTVITFYTAVFAFFYLVLHIKKLNKQSICQLVVTIVLVFILTAFFWIPMLEHKFGAEYEVFQPERMSRPEILAYLKLDFKQLFFTSQDKMIYEIGILSIIGMILAIGAVYKKKMEKEVSDHTIFFLMLGIISIFMTLKIFPFEKMPELFRMIQFSFRLLEFSGFFLSFVSAVGIGYIMKNFQIQDTLVLGVVASLLILPYLSFITYDKGGWEEEYLIPAFPVTQNTARVHAGCASFEYLPTKAFQNKDYIITRTDKCVILSGDANIKEEKRGTSLLAMIELKSGDLTVELPYIYYLGYSARLISQTGTEKLKLVESDKGFLSFTANHLAQDEVYILELSYTGTLGMKLRTWHFSCPDFWDFLDIFSPQKCEK